MKKGSMAETKKEKPKKKSSVGENIKTIAPAIKANKPAPMLGALKNVGHKPMPAMPVSTDRGNFKIK